MVRFSDMLGGDGESEGARSATESSDLPPVDDDPSDLAAPPMDESAESVADETTTPEAPEPSPQEVLERLTQYATATRAAGQARAEPVEAAEPADAPAVDPPAVDAPTDPPREPAASQADPAREPAAGDDILPHAKRTLRNPRGKR